MLLSFRFPLSAFSGVVISVIALQCPICIFIDPSQSIFTTCWTRSNVYPLLHTWNGLALVYVHTLPRVYVLEEASVAVQRVRALLAGVPPGGADGGAAKVAGTHHTLQLTGALAVPDTPVARTGPVRTRRSRAMHIITIRSYIS